MRNTTIESFTLKSRNRIVDLLDLILLFQVCSHSLWTLDLMGVVWQQEEWIKANVNRDGQGQEDADAMQELEMAQKS